MSLPQRSTKFFIDIGRIHDTFEGCDLVWWAYIHSSDRKIKVKRWIPPPEGKLCDLMYAQMEKKQDNNLIFALVDKPFTAPDIATAQTIAVHLFRGLGIELRPDCYSSLSATGVTTAERNRFRLLDVE